MKFLKNIDNHNKNILINILILILFIIIFLLILYFMLKEKETYNNNIPLLKFINKNNVNQIISTYPINNYPDSKKIKENNLTELIIPIEYNYNYIEKFTTSKESKEIEFSGPRGEPGYNGPPGENAQPCIHGSRGPPGPPGKNGVDCIPCEDGVDGKQGETGVGIESSSYDNTTGKIRFNYTNGEYLETQDIRGLKGDKGKNGTDCGKGEDGPQGPPGAAPGYLDRNWNRMYLPYINIQTNISQADPWIYTLGNNCFIIASLNQNKSRPAMFYRLNNVYKKLGYPWNTMDSKKDGGDDSGIVAIGERDSGSIKFKLEKVDYGSLSVISFWF